MDAATTSARARALVLGTLSFMFCFAAWGLIGAFGKALRQELGVSALAGAFLTAVPVLLGSLARIPLGMLTDRYGARPVFPVLMILAAGAAATVPHAHTYPSLLAVAFWLGLAGASFSVGVGFVSRWYPPQEQGGPLGIYGTGNVGQSLAVFLGPLVAKTYGRPVVFEGVALVLVVWAVVFALAARDAPPRGEPKTLGQMLGVLAREKMAWALSAFYFLTFGGFVAFSMYLPTLLQDQFGLAATDAGLRTAGFVVLATGLRPVGGWLADQTGGARVLAVVFAGIVPFALLLAWPSMVPFTVGALGCAALLGLGNGAVFKLVPQYFPAETGTVTGLVGAMGGLGGFFPPLLLGFFRDRMHAEWPGFVLLALTALALLALSERLFGVRQQLLELTLSPERRRTGDQVRAGLWATLAAGLLVAAIVVGSRNLENFDPALVVYTFAVVFAVWGVVYHYAVWLQKPPTQLYWRRGWELVRRRGVLPSLARLAATSVTHLAAQTFIFRRSGLRWVMHQCLFWGCLLAAAITFPLVFGWVHFTASPNDPMVYVAHLFGFETGSFRVRTLLSWVIFHGLDFSAILVLTGISLALWRRMTDQGARAVQDFAMDFLPLILLFAISMTGLALTVSTIWLRGAFYEFLAILHAITVIAALLYLPFGKFFHLFQRPAQLGVKLYQAAGDEGEGAQCARCGERYASRMHVDDLKTILPQLGFDYTLPGPAGNWQELCPACKRKTVASAQLRMKEEARG